MTIDYVNRPLHLSNGNLVQSLKCAALKVTDSDFSLKCAGVAFYGLMSLFPALGLSVTVYGLVIDLDTLESHLKTAGQFLPGQVYSVMEARLNDLVSSSETSLGLGLLVALTIVLWSSSRGTNSLMGVLGSAYKEPDRRPFLTAAAVSVSITVGAMVFAALAFFVVAAVPVAMRMLPLGESAEIIVRIASWVLMAVFAVIGLAALYRVAPYRHDARWTWVFPGALASAVLWLSGTALFSVYVENFGNYDATFGSIATVIVLMLWLYYSTVIVAFGAALNAQLELSTRLDTTRGPSRPMGERGAYVADNVRTQTPDT